MFHNLLQHGPFSSSRSTEGRLYTGGRIQRRGRVTTVTDTVCKDYVFYLYCVLALAFSACEVLPSSTRGGWHYTNFCCSCNGVCVYIVLRNQEAVSCFQELGVERLDGCVNVIINHVVEKCRESRELAGTLLLRLITEDLLTIDQFVDGSAARPLLCFVEISFSL